MQFACTRHRLRAIGHGKFGQDMFHMFLDRMDRNHQAGCNVLIGGSGCQQTEYLKLAYAERIDQCRQAFEQCFLTGSMSSIPSAAYFASIPPLPSDSSSGWARIAINFSAIAVTFHSVNRFSFAVT